MWIAACAIGWVIGCVSLYGFLVATAKEPVRGECVDCNLSECTNCPHAESSNVEIRRAA